MIGWALVVAGGIIAVVSFIYSIVNMERSFTENREDSNTVKAHVRAFIGVVTGVFIIFIGAVVILAPITSRFLR